MSNSGPPCQEWAKCREITLCTPEDCEHKQKGWKHAADHVRHLCAHDFRSGPAIEMLNGHTATCICGETALGHSLRYGP